MATLEKNRQDGIDKGFCTFLGPEGGQFPTSGTERCGCSRRQSFPRYVPIRNPRSPHHLTNQLRLGFAVFAVVDPFSFAKSCNSTCHRCNVDRHNDKARGIQQAGQPVVVNLAFADERTRRFKDGDRLPVNASLELHRR